MRLRDLDANFLNNVTLTGSHWTGSDLIDGAQGISFQCPTCAVGLEFRADRGRRYVVGAHYIQVLFRNPRNVVPAPPDAGVKTREGTFPRWEIAGGVTLDDLSLAPSINCDIPWKDEQGVEHPSVCKFHGYVKDGSAA